MEERDRNLLQKLKLIHEAFYNNQFERDSQLLTIMKEKEEKHAAKWDEQIKGSQILYKSIQRDFEKKLDDRDKNQRDTESYRQVEWVENLDLINNNLSKFLEVMTEMENTMNGLGKRQDQLNEKVDLSNQIFIEEQAEKESKKRKERMEMKFPPFPAHLDTLDLDPPNVYSSKQKRKKKYIHSLSDQHPFYPSFIYTVVLNRCKKSEIKIEICLFLFEFNLCVYFCSC